MKSDPEEAEVDEVKPHSKAVPPPELVSRLVDAFDNGAKLSCGSKDPNSLVEWTHFLNECKAEYIDVSGRDLNCLPACLCIYLNFEKPGKDVAAKMRERLADWCANFVEFPEGRTRTRTRTRNPNPNSHQLHLRRIFLYDVPC